MAIRRHDGKNPLDRPAFSFKILAVLLLLLVSAFLMPPNPAGWYIGAAVHVVMTAALAYWGAGRLYDIGTSKWLAMIATIPVIGVAFSIGLIIPRSKRR